VQATDDLGDVRVAFSQADFPPMPKARYRAMVSETEITKAKNPPKNSPPGTPPNTVVNVTFAIDGQAHTEYADRSQWRTFAVTPKAFRFLRDFLVVAGLPGAMMEEDEQQDPATGVIKRVPRYTLRQQVEYIKGHYVLLDVEIEEYTRDNPDGSKEVKERNVVKDILAAPPV